MLAVDPEQLDSVRFERLVNEGIAALATNEPEPARSRRSSGRSGSGAGPRSPTSPSRTSRGPRARGSRSFACSRSRKRVDASLALGRHAALAGELEALVAAHPLRERLGRPADARALPLEAPGGGARGLQPNAEAARRRARHRAEPGAPAAREGDPQPGSVARPARVAERRAAPQPPPADEPRPAPQQASPKDGHRALRGLRAHADARSTTIEPETLEPVFSHLGESLAKRRREARRLDPLVERDRDRRRVRHSARARGRCAAGGSRGSRAARGDRLAERRASRATSACGVDVRDRRQHRSGRRGRRVRVARDGRRLERRGAPRARGLGRRDPTSRTRRRSSFGDAVAVEPPGSDGGAAGWRLLEVVVGARGVERRLVLADGRPRARSSRRFGAPSTRSVRERCAVARHRRRACRESGSRTSRAPSSTIARRRVPRARRVAARVRRGKHLRAARRDRSAGRRREPARRDPRASSPADDERDVDRRAHRRGDRPVRERRPDRDDVLGGAQAPRGARARAAARRRARRPALGRADVPRSRRVRRRLGVRRADPAARPRAARAARRAARPGPAPKRNVSSLLLKPLADGGVRGADRQPARRLRARPGAAARGSREAAGGNPFFLEQMLAMHTRRGHSVAGRDPADDPGAARRAPRSARDRSSSRCSSARRSWARSSGRARPGRARVGTDARARSAISARARPEAADRADAVDAPGRRRASVPQRPHPRRRLRVGAEAVARGAARAGRRVACSARSASQSSDSTRRCSAITSSRRSATSTSSGRSTSTRAPVGRDGRGPPRRGRPARVRARRHGARPRACSCRAAALLPVGRPGAPRAAADDRRGAAGDRRLRALARTCSTRRSQRRDEGRGGLSERGRAHPALVEASSGAGTRRCDRAGGRAGERGLRAGAETTRVSRRPAGCSRGRTAPTGRYGDAADAARRAIEHADARRRRAPARARVHAVRARPLCTGRRLRPRRSTAAAQIVEDVGRRPPRRRARHEHPRLAGGDARRLRRRARARASAAAAILVDLGTSVLAASTVSSADRDARRRAGRGRARPPPRLRRADGARRDVPPLHGGRRPRAGGVRAGPVRRGARAEPRSRRSSRPRTTSRRRRSGVRCARRCWRSAGAARRGGAARGAGRRAAPADGRSRHARARARRPRGGARRSASGPTRRAKPLDGGGCAARAQGERGRRAAGRRTSGSARRRSARATSCSRCASRCGRRRGSSRRRSSARTRCSAGRRPTCTSAGARRRSRPDARGRRPAGTACRRPGNSTPSSPSGIRLLYCV